MKEKKCPKCGKKLRFVRHYEYDGVTELGNYEPYWECKNNCDIEETENE